MARKSNLEWDWDNDAPLSSVGGQVFLKELSQEEVKARHAEVRSKLKGGVEAVMMVNETMAKSDHRGQDALQHFRAGVHSVEISNETIAKSDGRGQRAIRHLKAAKNAIALTNLNKDRYHKHRKDFQPGHGSAATGMFGNIDGGEDSDAVLGSGDNEQGRSSWEYAQNTATARGRYQFKESRTPPPEVEDTALDNEDDLGDAHRMGMEMPELEQPAEKMSGAKHRLRAAIEAVEFANNYTRKYPDVAAAERAGRMEMLRKKYEDLEAQKSENEKARMELQSLHEEQRKQLITGDNASAEKLADLHEEQKEESDLLVAYHRASEKDAKQEVKEVNILHQQLIEHEAKSEETVPGPVAGGLKKGGAGALLPSSAASSSSSSSGKSSSKSKSREALVLGLMDEILAEEEGEEGAGVNRTPINPFSETGTRRSESEQRRRESVKASVRSAARSVSRDRQNVGQNVPSQLQQLNSAGRPVGVVYDNDYEDDGSGAPVTARSSRSMGGGGAININDPQADAIANAQALLAAHRQGQGGQGGAGAGGSAADSMQLQLMMSNLLALQNQQQQLQQQLSSARSNNPNGNDGSGRGRGRGASSLQEQEEEEDRVSVNVNRLPHPPRGGGGGGPLSSSSRARYTAATSSGNNDNNHQPHYHDDGTDSVSVLSEGSAKPLLTRATGDGDGDGAMASVSPSISIPMALSPTQREMREAATLPSTLHNLGSISEAHAGRPKVLLDNMQTQAHTFVREINVIKIQRIARAFLARLYVSYLREEKSVRENCAVMTMFSIINEVTIHGSVAVALEEFSDATKADVRILLSLVRSSLPYMYI